MARRNQDPVQARAHELLQEWASGPVEAHGVIEAKAGERVDGDVAVLSKPERYAATQARWNRLERAVRQVRMMSRELGRTLDQHYNDGVDEHECAESAGVGLRTWRDRLHTARAAFLAAYQMSGQSPAETARAGAQRG